MSTARLIRTFTLTATVLLGLALAACNSDDKANVDTETDTELVVASDFAVPQAFEDPLVSEFETAWGNAEMLLRPTQGSYEPWLAESVEQEKETVWRITLKPDVTFQSGKPLDAQAVVAWLRYELENDPGVAVYLPGVTSVTPDGDRDVLIETKKPLYTLPSALADYRLPVYDSELVESVDGNFNKLAGRGAWTGPFEFTKITSRELIYDANPDYWGGKPALKQVRFVKIPDAQSGVRAVRAGEADIFPFVPAKLKPTTDKTPGAHFVSGADFAVIFAAALNFNKPPFDDRAVREAFSLAIDYEALSSGAMFGVYNPLKGFYPSDSPFAVDWEKFDLEEAKRVLDDAGWTEGSEGVREKDGERLEAEIVTYTEDLQTMAVAAQEMLKRAGFETKVSTGDVDFYLDRVKSGNWGVIFNQGVESFGLNGNPVLSMRAHFVPADTPNANPAAINEPEVNELFDKIQLTQDQDVITDGLKRVQEINADNVWWVSLMGRTQTAIASDAWDGYVCNEFFLCFDKDTKPPERSSEQ